MNNLDRIKSLRAQDYGVAGLSTTDVDWLIAEVERMTAELDRCKAWQDAVMAQPDASWLCVTKTDQTQRRAENLCAMITAGLSRYHSDDRPPATFEGERVMGTTWEVWSYVPHPILRLPMERGLSAGSRCSQR